MDIPEILYQKYGREYKPGQLIFCEWEPGNSLFFVLQGRVKIVKIFGKNIKTLDVIGEGGMFGEMALLEEEPRSASAIAIDRVKLLEFNRENFNILIHKQPQLAYNLLILFAKRIYDAKRRLKNLLIEDHTARVIDVFLMLSENDPTAIQMNRVSLNFTVDDIANWCGLPISEVNVIITNLVKQGKVELYVDKIIIPNLKDLQRLVIAKSKSGLRARK